MLAASWLLAFALVAQEATPSGIESADERHRTLDVRAGWRPLPEADAAKPLSAILTALSAGPDADFELEYASAGDGDKTRLAWRDGRLERWFAGELATYAHLDELPRPSATDLRDPRVRNWSKLEHDPVDLLRGDALDGWTPLGDAVYERDGDGILGYVGGGAQSFLMTEREFGDFVLELDVKAEQPGNSGIQVRSHVNAAGRLYGYQIEIDPSERAWSGGLYDEARRGWLDDLADNPKARAAFRQGEWNRYRIECIGPRIQTWINGVPAANYIDDADQADTRGHIALQVHSGNNTRVRWRNLRLRVLD